MEKSQDMKKIGLQILIQYIKDLSFEVPFAPEIFRNSEPQPAVDVHVSVDHHKQIEDALYEVILEMKLIARVDQKEAFVLDIHYGAVVGTNAEGDERDIVLSVETPRLLFPFVRQKIVDLTQSSGFPPVVLQPIDFFLLYRQRQDSLKESPLIDENKQEQSQET